MRLFWYWTPPYSSSAFGCRSPLIVTAANSKLVPSTSATSSRSTGWSRGVGGDVVAADGVVAAPVGTVVMGEGSGRVVIPSVGVAADVMPSVGTGGVGAGESPS